MVYNSLAFVVALNRPWTHLGSSKRKYSEKDGLFFKFQGHSDAALKEVAKIVKAVCEKNGGSGFKLASEPAEADAMWSDRKNALDIGLSLYPDAKGWSTDVWCESHRDVMHVVLSDIVSLSSVPVSKLPELVYETKKDLAAAEIPSMLVGHAGDGNFHALLLYKTEDELDVAKIVVNRMVKRAIDLDGTCLLPAFLPRILRVNVCGRYRRAWRGCR
jgi:D-lactate dehydrogenase (cytochrome)